MGWGELMSDIGQGLMGGVNVWQANREFEQKNKLAEQMNELKLLIAQGNNSTKLAVVDKQNAGKQALLEPTQAGNLDLQRLKNEGMAYVRELQNAGMLDVEDVRAVSRMNLKNIDKDIQAAHDATAKQVGAGHDAASVKVGAGHDAASVQVGAGHDAASTYGADMGYSRATDVANINQEGASSRADADRPLKIFRANQGRYPRGSAAAKRATSISQPTFGPSYSEFMNSGGANPSGIPGPMMRDQFPQPPNLSPAPSVGPPQSTPSMPPRQDFGPESPPKQSLSSSGFIGGAPAPAGRSMMTEQRIEEQGRDLMARITQLQQEGKFDQARALKQQLADLIKQQ